MPGKVPQKVSLPLLAGLVLCLLAVGVVARVQRAYISDEAREKIFHLNVERLLRTI